MTDWGVARGKNCHNACHNPNYVMYDNRSELKLLRSNLLNKIFDTDSDDRFHRNKNTNMNSRSLMYTSATIANEIVTQRKPQKITESWTSISSQFALFSLAQAFVSASFVCLSHERSWNVCIKYLWTFAWTNFRFKKFKLILTWLPFGWGSLLQSISRLFIWATPIVTFERSFPTYE